MQITKKTNFLLLGASFGVAVFFLPVYKAITEASLVFAILIWLQHNWRTDHPIRVPNVIILSYIIFYIAILTSLFFTPSAYLGTAARGILKWLKYLLFFFLSCDFLIENKQSERLFWIFAIAILMVSFNGFYQLIAGHDLLMHHALNPGRILRMKSSLNGPNQLACFYLFAIPIAVYFLFSRKNSFRRAGFSLSALTIFFISFVFTYSRAAFFALLIAAVFNLILSRKSKWALVVLGLATTMILLLPSLRSNFIENLSFNDISLEERIGYWKTSFHMIQASPFFGRGVNTFHDASPLFAAPGGTYQGYAHNCYLQMWAEIGIFGLVAFLIPVVVTLLESYRRFDRFQLEHQLSISCLRTSLIAYLLQSFFDTNLYALQTATLFWIFWGIFVGLVYKIDETNS